MQIRHLLNNNYYMYILVYIKKHPRIRLSCILKLCKVTVQHLVPITTHYRRLGWCRKTEIPQIKTMEKLALRSEDTHYMWYLIWWAGQKWAIIRVYTIYIPPLRTTPSWLVTFCLPHLRASEDTVQYSRNHTLLIMYN